MHRPHRLCPQQSSTAGYTCTLELHRARTLFCRFSYQPAYTRHWVVKCAKAPQAVPGSVLDWQLEQGCWGHLRQVPLEEARVMFLQRTGTLLDTSWPRHTPMVHEAGVLDNPILPSPVKINESHVHRAAIHSPAGRSPDTSAKTAANKASQRMQRHIEQAAEDTDEFDNHRVVNAKFLIILSWLAITPCCYCACLWEACNWTPRSASTLAMHSAFT